MEDERDGVDDDLLSVELGPSGRLRAVVRALAAVSVAVAVTVGVLFVFGRRAMPNLVLVPIQVLAAMAPMLVVNLRTTVRIDADGVRIVGGPQNTRGAWSWDDLLEVCLTRHGNAWTLAVRPRGSTWDQPGPTAPAVVRPPMKDRATVERAQSALRAWCTTRDVVFTETAAGLDSAPPGSALRT